MNVSSLACIMLNPEFQTILFMFVFVLFFLISFSIYCTLSGRTGGYPDDDFRKKKKIRRRTGKKFTFRGRV